MSGRGDHEPDSKSHSWMNGVGWVPSAPRSDACPNVQLDREEEYSERSSRYPGISRASSNYPDGYSRPSRESSYYAERYRPRHESHRSSKARSWTSSYSRGLHEGHRIANGQGSRHTGGGRRHETPFCDQQRSRSRSPCFRRDPNANIFSRTGGILAGPDDSPYPTRASSLNEVPPCPDVDCSPPEDCQCSISWHCPHRPGELPDCRPLVPRFRAWVTKQVHQCKLVERASQNLHSDAPANVAKLNQLAKYLSKLTHGPRPRNDTTFELIRSWITEVQAWSFVINEEILQTCRVLVVLKEFLCEENKDLRIAAKVPSWIEEDLEFLMRRWTKGDLVNHPDRGLIREVKDNFRTRPLLDKTWPHYKSANYFGAGDLVNGQRWKKRVHMMSEGAHGASIAGIWGNSVEEGCQAVVMGKDGQDGGGWYADRDEGTVVWYIGTARKKKCNSAATAIRIDDCDNDEPEGKGPTNHTRMLMTSIETERPIRLIRSDKLPHKNKYRPAQGYRYDGLYQAVGSELLEPERQIYRFELHRLPDQGPIREIDMRTFEETPEELVERTRQKERSASSRASVMPYLS